MTITGPILVFDLGTSYFKATLFSPDGELLALARIATPFTRAQGVYSEVTVPAFDNALDTLARELQQQAPEAWATVAAVTFSSQTNSFVLLDADNDPLTPFIIWNDRRATRHNAPLDALAGLPGFYEKTGVPGLSPEFMVAKLHWYQDQTPELWERVARIALLSDYFTWRFTGQFVTEAGAAGLTGLVDIHALDWWPEALEAIALDRESLSHVVRAGSPLGAITTTAADAFNLPADCEFVVGCLDQYAGAIGAGNVQPGNVSETTGTVLATVRCADHFVPTPGSGVFWGPAAIPGHYYQMVFGDVSANLLDAFQKALPEPRSFAELDALAERTSTGALSLPRDLDTPELLDTVRQWATTQPTGDAVRAILEGVGQSLAQQVAQLCGEQPPAELHGVGGAARSAVWARIKADIVGVPMRAVACEEPTSLGAALLAVATLTDTPLADIVKKSVRLETT